VREEALGWLKDGSTITYDPPVQPAKSLLAQSCSLLTPCWRVHSNSMCQVSAPLYPTCMQLTDDCAAQPANVCPPQGQQSNTRGGPFAVLNGSLASDVLVVALAEGAKLQQPLHVLHVSTAAAEGSSGSGPVLAASTARLLISLGANASCELVEEYVSDAAGHHVSMPVAEVQLGAGSELKHGYVEREAAGAQHFKATLVTQVGGWVEAGLEALLASQTSCMAPLTHHWAAE